MGRPFYQHEADDPDLDWLVTNFLYERSDFIPVESDMLPLILMPYHEAEIIKADDQSTGVVELSDQDKVSPTDDELTERR